MIQKDDNSEIASQPEAWSRQEQVAQKTAQQTAPETAWLSRKWSDLTFVGFDTETTGKYPLQAEICEIAAVKWQGGQVIDTFSSLVKPSAPMGPEVIAIHGITNEMVESAPCMKDVIGGFHQFIQGAIPIAHHAPFDLGFVSIDFELAGLALPDAPALCSSLLSRKLFPESENHRLQTLIKFFGLEQGVAHRALDDAKACLEVGLRCMRRVGDETLLIESAHAQGGALSWQRFSLRELEVDPLARTLLTAIRGQKVIEMVYGSGSKPGEMRRAHPLGVVRSLDGDFIVAYDEAAQQSKRFIISRIISAEIV
jgi:DNA polymerase-3 subunit epsilon